MHVVVFYMYDVVPFVLAVLTVVVLGGCRSLKPEARPTLVVLP